MGKRREVESAVGSAGRSSRGSRLTFACALTALMLGTFVSFGGLSYAGTATSSAVHTLEKVTTGHKVVVHHSSASDQYAKPKPKQKQIFKPPSRTSPGSSGQVLKQGMLPFT